MTPLDVALAHLERFPTDYLFPLAKLSKFPPLLKKNLSDNSSNDPAQLRKWDAKFPSCNWGIALRRSQLIVADIDVSKGKPGRQTMDWLDVQYTWPRTMTVMTPSDGYHLYYRGQHVMKVGGFGPAVDSPNYVVCPGMKVQDGKAYRYVNARPRAEAATWFYELLAPKERVVNASDAVIELDQPHNIAHGIDYLLHDAPPAIEGEGGEFRTMKTAMGLRDYGISEQTALELILDHYNGRCSPPWDDIEELTKKIANGYAYASMRPIGGATAEADFANDEPPDPNSIPTIPKDRSKNFVILDGKKFSVARTPRPQRSKKGPKNGT